MIDLSSVKSEALLAELLSREQVSNAPIKTTYGEGMKVLTVGIGANETATVAIHVDALQYLFSGNHHKQ